MSMNESSGPATTSHAAEARETLKRYFEHLFANSRDIMNLFSLTEGKIILVNRAGEEATGYSTEELSTLPVDALYPPEEHAKLALAFERLKTTGYSSEKLRMYARNGELCDIWTRSYVIQREPETICLVHTIDITEENRKHERELRNAKLATLGESSATLAHELKNALQSMQFSLGALRRHMADKHADRVEVSLARVERAAAHMDDVIAGIERSTHGSSAGSSDVSIPSAVQNALQLMRGYLDAKQIHVVSEFDRSLPLVWCDRTQLEQILIVLIKNAAQAMASRDLRELRVNVVGSGERVRLEIADTGGGLPTEIEKRVFEAFSTTKPAGLGMGLGLTTAKRLAEGNGIDLTFRSQGGVGTTFALEFSSTRPRKAAASPLEGRVLLVLGDDPTTLDAACSALTQAGARVLIATTVADALQCLRVHTVEAVVCDDALYPVGAQAFVAEARRMYRGPVCLVVNHPDLQGAGRHTEVEFVLRKPLASGALVDALVALVT